MGTGFVEGTSGLIVGTIYSALQNSASPSAKFLFIVVGILGAIATIKQVATASITFIIGWIFGTWLLKSLWSFLDYIVFMVVVIILIYVLFRAFSH